MYVENILGDSVYCVCSFWVLVFFIHLCLIWLDELKTIQTYIQLTKKNSSRAHLEIHWIIIRVCSFDIS